MSRVPPSTTAREEIQQLLTNGSPGAGTNILSELALLPKPAGVNHDHLAGLVGGEPLIGCFGPCLENLELDLGGQTSTADGV